jgi:hypothetical protein
VQRRLLGGRQYRNLFRAKLNRGIRRVPDATTRARNMRCEHWRLVLEYSPVEFNGPAVRQRTSKPPREGSSQTGFDEVEARVAGLKAWPRIL